ncbi:MAG: C39 family peptidase [Candidatus Kerfeldbacteria bacterium]|nr:C39 family peptidase [Candidatus Kerfeldbacteria bacterium]
MTSLRIPYFHQKTDYTCGPAVVRMILRHFKKNISEASLSRRLKTNRAIGTHPRAIITFLRRAGLYVYLNESSTMAELAFLISKKYPVIVLYREPVDNEGHYAIVVEINRRIITLHDPWHGRHFKISPRSFNARWQTFEPGMRSRHWLIAVAQNNVQIDKQFHS